MRDGLQLRGKPADVDQDRWRDIAGVAAAFVMRGGPVPVVDVEAFRGLFIIEYGASAGVVQVMAWWSDRGKLLDALHGRIDLIQVLIYAHWQRAPAPADENRDMTVLVHPEPIELESRELVSPRHLRNTDAMAVTREPANRNEYLIRLCLPSSAILPIPLASFRCLRRTR
jgi:hypothetical protein